MTTLTHIGNKLTFPDLKLMTPAFSSKFFKILKKAGLVLHVRSLHSYSFLHK